MSQKKNLAHSKTINNAEETQKKRLVALKERQREKDQENMKRLEATFKPLEGNDDFERFFIVKEKLYNTRKDREATRDRVYQMKHEFEELKNRLKDFIREQVVTSSKLTVPRTQKAKTVTQ